MHTKDSDCTINEETLLCEVCGVDHSDECIDCAGRGFHKPTCPYLLNQQKEAKEDEIIENALTAFWASIAKAYPQATHGDLSPDVSIRLKIAAHDAITEWVEFNVPTAIGN